MAGTEGMYLFEVVVESVQSRVNSKHLIIKSEFADIFSLELRDPKQLKIVMPEPPPLPPDPPGKKGKKPKPPKKGKKGKIELPPPEPVIQSGQSILFPSTSEFLIQNMRKFPLELSLWNKEDNLVFIGSTCIPWDEVYLIYLTKIANCGNPEPVFVRDDYNIFEEGTAKLMATLGLQIKLTYLKNKVTTAFRTLSEDPTSKKYLYTGLNSPTTSYICTMKTTDETFIENSNKIENNYTQDQERAKTKPAIQYASFKNAPGANLTFFNDGDYCCMSMADKAPESIYKSPETLPSIDFIMDYVRKIIVSCNDNLRMLTPRPTIRPRIKATDMDRLCYCKQTGWPKSELADRMKKDVQTGPCPICVDAGKKQEDSRNVTIDIANLRGPCGKFDCRIARDLRLYIEKIVEEDNQMVDINEIIGPCGSKACTLAEKVQEFLRKEGLFTPGSTSEGLATQCSCVQQMYKALTTKPTVCQSVCSKDCINASDSSDSENVCGGERCPVKKKVYDVYYCTVNYNFNNEEKSPTASKKPSPTQSETSSRVRICPSDCPIAKSSNIICSKSTCSTKFSDKQSSKSEDKCDDLVCPNVDELPISPADSDVVVNFDDLYNPCCVKTCDVAEKVKDFIEDGYIGKQNKTAVEEDPCYCDCTCTFKLTRRTTYCPVCGGFEVEGDDLKDQPIFAKPHPCPVYHKLYNKKYLKVPNPWGEEEHTEKEVKDAVSIKSTRSGKRGGVDNRSQPTSDHREVEEKKKDIKRRMSVKGHKGKKVKKDEKEAAAKFPEDANAPPPEPKKAPKSTIPFVPKHMGWLWTAEDIPGLKPRPKWKPGAANKILVRRYKAMQGQIDLLAKKKRAMLQRRKKLEMKPTLVVKKTDGEYTVQMEVFRKYSKERFLFQYPYEEKVPLIYTIGKTEEEKRKINIKRERRERRETRRKSRLIQSTFRDMCQEICVKAYNQAIGLLPLPNPNDPECPCHTTAAADAVSPPIDSCSCSDVGSISTSDTDGDDWIIEFTPPGAKWDAKAKHPPVMTESESQYTYLDYKVKLLDKSGNQVPRFFKGPDGKQECSDLGGFWSPQKVWLEINKDGYIGVDNRWIPMNFIGPDGMFYTAEDGFFTDNNGQTLKLGIDGYIDKDGKWAWYPKRCARDTKGKLTGSGINASSKVNKKTDKARGPEDNKQKKKQPESKGKQPATKGKSAPAKSLGPKDSAKLKTKVNKVVSYSSNVKIKNPLVMSASIDYNKLRSQPLLTNRYRQINTSNLERYREIMDDLEFYESLPELKVLSKTNRASNTPRKKLSPFTIFTDYTERKNIN